MTTETTHVHALLSWRQSASWESVRRALRYRCTVELNRAFGGGRPWLAQGASRRRVRDSRHFRYLMDVYLPRHSGLSWRED